MHDNMVEVYHLLTLRGAIRLEMLGLKHSSGKSATSAAKKLLGLGKSTRTPTVLQTLETKIEELKSC